MFLRRSTLQQLARENHENGRQAMQPTVTSLRAQTTRLDQMALALYQRIGELSAPADVGRAVSEDVAALLSGLITTEEFLERAVDAAADYWFYQQVTAEVNAAISVEAQVQGARLLGERLLKESREISTGDNTGYAAVVALRGDTPVKTFP